MLDIGSLEFFLIIVIALVVVGPQQLPEVAKTLGRAVGKFRQAVNRLKEESQVDQYVQEFKHEMGLQEQDEVNSILKPVSQVTDEIKEVTQSIKRERKKVSAHAAKQSKSQAVAKKKA